MTITELSIAGLLLFINHSMALSNCSNKFSEIISLYIQQTIHLLPRSTNFDKANRFRMSRLHLVGMPLHFLKVHDGTNARKNLCGLSPECVHFMGPFTQSAWYTFQSTISEREKARKQIESYTFNLASNKINRAQTKHVDGVRPVRKWNTINQ